ncbi:MAG: phytoene/squalene synthase family protein [Bacteroidota bacterium]
MNIDFFIKISYRISGLVTKSYSTSFSLAASLLHKKERQAIYAIYGFVRLADEIVDSFHDHDKAFLLDKLDEDLDAALKHGISTNPVLVAFADTVSKYEIDRKHIRAFMESMRRDISQSNYDNSADIEQYIYGSANVVGLMCLKVFCGNDQRLYENLQRPAEKLGSAFQKVNFIRDLKDDMFTLGRNYFPEIVFDNLNAASKREIEQSIERDFSEARTGIKHLPGRSKLAVAIAYHYYKGLFQKIKQTSTDKLLSKRIRLSNFKKYLIISKVWILFQLKQI